MAASDPHARSGPRARSAFSWLDAGALADRLEEEVARAERHGTALSCLLVVVEGLEEMTRRYGGDLPEQALTHLARALRGELRRFDQVGRPSDRELLLVLPGADSTRGEIVARRALWRLRTIKIEAGGQRRALPIAIGLAAWRAGLSGRELLEAAREAAGAREADGEADGGDGDGQPGERPAGEPGAQGAPRPGA